MADEEPKFSFQQPRSMFSTWVGVVLLFAFFGLLVWAVMGAMPRGDNYEQKRATARTEKLKTTRDEANGALSGYAWVDKTKGVVRVPIDRAMELSVAELAQKKPAPANPIPPEGAQPGLQVTAPVAPQPAAAAPAPSPSPELSSREGAGSESRGQPAAAANPPNANPGTQPGPNATPAASAPAPSRQFQPETGPKPIATPVQSPPGTPLPVPGKTP